MINFLLMETDGAALRISFLLFASDYFFPSDGDARRVAENYQGVRIAQRGYESEEKIFSHQNDCLTFILFSCRRYCVTYIHASKKASSDIRGGGSSYSTRT
jgi:hypothetical protein